MKKRDWLKYLSKNFNFPVVVEKIDDDDSILFHKKCSDEFFSIGHKMKITEISSDEDLYGIIVKVKEKKKTGYLPLIYLEVTEKNSSNYKILKKYLDFFSTELI